MGKWVTAFAVAPREGKLGRYEVADHTVRLTTTFSLSGDMIRLRFGNLFGKDPMKIGRIVIHAGENAAEITFGGQPSLLLAPGSTILSDEAYLPVKADEPVSILIYFPVGAPEPHSLSGTWKVEGSEPGDFTDCPDFTAVEEPLLKTDAVPFPMGNPLPGLMNIDLWTNEDAFAVAAFGDSITEMRLWFDPLNAYFHENYKEKCALLNLGISGNRLLYPTGGPIGAFGGNLFGVSGLDRYEVDILQASGVKTVLLALGVNDATQPGSGEMSPPVEERCTLENFAEGVMQFVKVMHENSIKVIGCTVTPFGDMGGYCDETRMLRIEMNKWFAEAAKKGEIDGVVDFGGVIEDPDKPDFMTVEYDSGDHLHPSPLGGEVMAKEAEKIDFLA